MVRKRLPGIQQVGGWVHNDDGNIRAERRFHEVGRVKAPDDARAAPLFHADKLLFALAPLKNVQSPGAVAVHVLQDAAAHVAANFDRRRKQYGNLRRSVKCSRHELTSDEACEPHFKRWA